MKKGEVLKYLPVSKIVEGSQKNIMVIFDNPLKIEVQKGESFSAPSLRKFLSGLSHAGIKRTEIHLSYLAGFYPIDGDLKIAVKGKKSSEDTEDWVQVGNVKVKNYLKIELDRLKREISLVNPKIILVAGKWALYLLTEVCTYTETARSPYGVLLIWRGSHLQLSDWWNIEDKLLIPTLPPNAEYKLPETEIFRQFDFSRVKVVQNNSDEYLKPNWDIVVCKTYSLVKEQCLKLLLKLELEVVKVSVDIETENGYLDCIGFAYEPNKAFVVPIASEDPLYWTESEEVEITYWLLSILLHENCRIIGQNFMFDMQYLYRFWGINVAPDSDTMINQHVLSPESKKDLATLSSFYCSYHRYWKEEGKLAKGATREERWKYNGKDVITTLEIASVQEALFQTVSTKLQEVRNFQLKLIPIVANLMNRGVKIDIKRRKNLTLETERVLRQIEKEFLSVGLEYNLNSAPQLKELLYDALQAPIQYDRKTGAISCGDEARKKIVEADVLYKPFCDRIDAYKKYSTLLKTFLRAKLDYDNRMRTQYLITGTITFRFASRTNAFGTGANLQNIPDGGTTSSGIKLPSMKQLFLPDKGNVLWDADFVSADARFVAAECESRYMLDIFEKDKDLYTELASEYYQKPVNKESLERKKFKVVTHACLTEEHEVLTKIGWVSLKSFCESPDRELMVFDPKTDTLFFEKPQGVYVAKVKKGDMLTKLVGRRFDQTVTEGHKLPAIATSSEAVSNIQLLPFENIRSRFYIPIVAENGFKSLKRKSTFRLNFNIIAVLIKFGDFSNSSAIINFPNKRLFNEFCEYSKQSGDCKLLTKAVINASRKVIMEIPHYWEYRRLGNWILTELSRSDLEKLYQALVDWGEISHGEVKYITFGRSKDHNAEWFLTLQALVGKKGSIYVTSSGTVKISLTKAKNVIWKNIKKNVFVPDANTRVYCPSTSTGAFLIRKGDKIQITGNTHYLGKESTIASNAGLKSAEVRKLQQWYFAKNPELKRWHNRLKMQVDGRGWIENVFGYRYRFIDRSKPTRYNVAAAWIAQSSVSILINKVLARIETEYPDWLQILLQVHDSLVGQFPLEKKAEAEKLIMEAFHIPIQYSWGELIIPASMKSSDKSWGDCK